MLMSGLCGPLKQDSGSQLTPVPPQQTTENVSDTMLGQLPVGVRGWGPAGMWVGCRSNCRRKGSQAELGLRRVLWNKEEEFHMAERGASINVLELGWDVARLLWRKMVPDAE